MMNFKKSKDFLICVDSDGCAVDTMTTKHAQAFCPELIRVFGLQSYSPQVTEFWMKYNLYSRTRGVNRFVGLAAVLDMLAEEGIPMPEQEALHRWLAKTHSFSGEALRADLSGATAPSLVRVLEWSDAVNKAIKNMTQLPHAYDGVAQALHSCAQYADIAVVSSANHTAITEEWTHCGLLEYTNVVLGQEAGTKAACIKALLQQGYHPANVIMIGDALGDRQAAEENGVLFFPILPRHEAESWHTWSTEGVSRFVAGKFDESYAQYWLQQQSRLLP